MSFWDHLEVLRGVVIKVIAVVVVCGVVAFLFKTPVFDMVLAPKEADFVTYRLLHCVSSLCGEDMEPFYVQLVSTGLAQQFVIHVKTALCVGAICASPYVVYQLFRFVSPALYERERHYAVRLSLIHI